MRLKFLLLTFLCSVSSAYAVDALDDLYEKLQRDFDSKPHFFNSSINDFRDGVMSPFIAALYGKDEPINNAKPIHPSQLAKLPDGRFLDKAPFYLAMKGRERLLKAGKIKNHPILAVADFSRHSKARRLFIMDIAKGEVLMNTYTSHAYKSDADKDGYAETFSNVSGSNLSSLGFMSSDVTYYGNYGYSLRLKGHDPVLNSNVFSRAMVFHGFGGMSPQEAAWGGVATSEGCYMISTSDSGRFWGMEDKPLLELVIKILKPGSLVFTYIDESDELFKSTWIKKTDIPAEVVEEEPAEEEPAPVPAPEPEKPKPVPVPEVSAPAPQPTAPVEVPYEQEENSEEEVVEHRPGRGKILNARPEMKMKERSEE